MKDFTSNFGFPHVKGMYLNRIICCNREIIINRRAHKTSSTNLNLSLHRDTEEGYEVHDKDGPKHRDVEELKEGTEECNRGGLGCRIPELELRQPPDERSKLRILGSLKHVWTI